MRVLIIALMLLTGTAYAQDNWSAFYFPVDASMAPDYQGVAAESFDAGKELLDAPAGKHGFSMVVGAHFYFSDGARARFWGTNLCGNACFPGHEQAELMAERIGYFGFNAVRLVGMDFSLEPGGIFEDVSPDVREDYLKPTTFLSPRQLDKLDYLIYQLKQRGIYVSINLLAARPFSETDGVTDAAKLGPAAKPVCLFDATLIKLQKDYAKNLLTHLNPYTKLRYFEDPAICMVEINNAATLAGLDLSALPEFYHKEYNGLLEAWLSEGKRRELYEGPQLSIVPEVRDWDMEKHSGTAMMKTIGGDEVTLYVTKTTRKAWHLQFCINKVLLEKGQDYTFRFEAKAAKPVRISVETQQHYPPWRNLGLDEVFELTDEFQVFEAPFRATENCRNAKVGFVVGYAPADITIKNVELFENLMNEEKREFNFDLEKKYLTEMHAFLRDEVGVKVPIGVGGHADAGQAAVQAEALDYIDRQAFWDRPVFPGKPGDLNDFRISDESIFAEPDQGILAVFESARKAKPGQPRTLSEWSQCYPNQYAYETPLLLAEKARKGDWDALFQYSFSHGNGEQAVYDYIHSFYDINANAQQLMLDAFAARIFLNESEKPPFRYGVTKKNAVVKVGKTTLKIGQIKNSDSRWNADGTYSWGSAPTLLQQ